MSIEYCIPADVPHAMHTRYHDNYHAITGHIGRLMLFSCDQKIEHMNDDFDIDTTHAYGVAPDHLFKIAQEGRIGALSTYLGMVGRHYTDHSTTNLIIKLNAKTNLNTHKEDDPRPGLLYTINDVIQFMHTNAAPIRGVSFNIYLGGIHEHEMLTDAARIITQAHAHGLIVILSVQARGKTVVNERDYHLIAGCAGVAHALGADFVKIKMPEETPHMTTQEALKIAVKAAGNTKVICSGNITKENNTINLATIYDTIHNAGLSGCVIGRAVFQKSLVEAIAITQSIAAIIYDNEEISTAQRFIVHHNE